jgi:CRISPR/Cas system CSM-associated protein Csm2 small subunit
MSKQCEICKDPINPKFSLCFDCKESRKFPDPLKIKDTFYNNNKTLKEDVFLDLPERTARLFAQGGMGMNKLRAFFCMVRNAYDLLNLDRSLSLENIKPQLWALQRAVEDRTRRGVTPKSFREFINFYLQISLKNKEELYGFVELFRSVIAYSK